MALQKGEKYRCPDSDCGCEIEVTKGAAPGKGGNHPPRCCCAKEMQKVKWVFSRGKLIRVRAQIASVRLGYVLFYQPDYYLARPWKILMIWQGGLASHGGFIGVLIALHFYWRNYRDMSFLELSDRLAIAVAPAASLIRVGNFFNSEIIGVPATVPWAVIFLRIDSVPRHPVMLYEAAAYLLIFSALYVAY